MKMAKPSERDIEAAGNLMSLLHQIDRGDYPNLDEDKDVPDWFDEDNFDHLRAFYDAVKSTLDKGPGYPARVIGGMCYVIMYDKNEIVDPNSDTIDLHPKLVKALEMAEAGQQVAQGEKGGDAKPLTRCAAGRDGECSHAQCPQLRDREPTTTGRHCPLDNHAED